MSSSLGGGMPPKPVTNPNLPLSGIKVVEGKCAASTWSEGSWHWMLTLYQQFSGTRTRPLCGHGARRLWSGRDPDRQGPRRDSTRTACAVASDRLPCRPRAPTATRSSRSWCAPLMWSLIPSAPVCWSAWDWDRRTLTREIKKGLIFARLTGFQRTGPYAQMAGHDINYIALSGVLSMLGQAGGKPQPPSNLLGDFAGGSMICLLGILLALVERARSSQGQVVEADMVTGARYVSSFVLLSSYLSHPSWGAIHADGTDETRGSNTLDGGAPWIRRCTRARRAGT
ncbi:hypothetical protein L1887_46795 [Cichorium endivia]|nr:hypothetical protein L1887_46795 [Cichorium endivia]